MIQCCDQEKQCKRETKTECTTRLCAVIAGEGHPYLSVLQVRPFEIYTIYRERNVYLKLEIRYDKTSGEQLWSLVSKGNSELYFDLKTGKVKEKIQATSAQKFVLM